MLFQIGYIGARSQGTNSIPPIIRVHYNLKRNVIQIVWRVCGRGATYLQFGTLQLIKLFKNQLTDRTESTDATRPIIIIIPIIIISSPIYHDIILY